MDLQAHQKITVVFVTQTAYRYLHFYYWKVSHASVLQDPFTYLFDRKSGRISGSSQPHLTDGLFPVRKALPIHLTFVLLSRSSARLAPWRVG